MERMAERFLAGLTTFGACTVEPIFQGILGHPESPRSVFKKALN